MNPLAEAHTFKLYNHPVFKELKDLNDCRTFMEHHIYAVWDFMSLVKKVQAIFAPTKTPWMPSPYTKYRHFINEIILAEESDTASDGRVMSHCEMYLEAMQEIGASTKNFERFLSLLKQHDLSSPEIAGVVPASALSFMQHTFTIVNSKSPHKIISAFCYGRENIIPGMFDHLLKNLGLPENKTPMFVEYLKKHIELDGDEHGPMAIQMVDLACKTEKQSLEAEQTAIDAIQARIKFWDGVQNSITKERQTQSELQLN